MTQFKQKIPNSVGVLVLGIVSIPTCFCMGIIGITCGIISLILHKKGMALYHANPETYDESGLGMMNAGKICAIIGLCLGALYFIFNVIVIIVGATDPFQDLMRSNPF